jgi:uncharacterized protein GlcG (DUF336 family)
LRAPPGASAVIDASRKHAVKIGVPMNIAVVDGRIVGAIGVSGGRPDQDHEVAAAGAAAFVPRGETGR